MSKVITPEQLSTLLGKNVNRALIVLDDENGLEIYSVNMNPSNSILALEMAKFGIMSEITNKPNNFH